MKLTQLFLRCYAEKVGNQWQAFCLDLSLAAQGDTFPEVKQKLDLMIVEYVKESPTMGLIPEIAKGPFLHLIQYLLYFGLLILRQRTEIARRAAMHHERVHV